VSFLRKRRGVSGIISGLFLVAVAVMVFNVLAWQFFQYDAYHRIALERDQREWERFNERILISDVGSGSYLRFEISNIGGVAAHIVTVYLNDTTANVPQSFGLNDYITSNCSAWVGSGAKRWIYTTIPLVFGNVYDLKVTTERGNMGIVLKFKASGSETPEGTQFVPFTFSFRPEDYQWSSYIGGPWNNAWVFTASGSNVYFRVKVKNTAGGTVVVETRSHVNIVITSGASAMQSKANAALTSAVELAEGSEGWLVFGPIDKNKFDQGTFQYYNFFAVFYHYLSQPSVTLGTTVAILASEITR